jgi:hypothetical protein
MKEAEVWDCVLLEHNAAVWQTWQLLKISHNKVI